MLSRMNSSLDTAQVRACFPVLHQSVNGKPLVYLDNAATTQKPQVVIDALVHYYMHDNSNVHRGIHTLSNRATEAYEGARKRLAQFLNAKSTHEIVFTRGTTEAINLVAATWGRRNLKKGDRILLTEMEHHSNIVPWQVLAEATGAELKYIPVDLASGLLDVSALDEQLADGVKLFAFTHISNTLGTVNPAREFCARARAAGVVTLVDAAQSAGHRPVDVQEMGCDFLVLSGHKMCAPTGIGALFGSEEMLEHMPPYQGGGDMISRVDFFESRYNTLPYKFEAGTPNIADAVAFAAALDYLDTIGRDVIRDHDRALGMYAWERLREMDGVTVVGPDPHLHEKAGVVSFLMADVHAHDVVMLMDRHGVALRGGHHCNQPLMRKLGTQATSRASFYLYNDRSEVDVFIDALQAVRKFFQR